MGFSVTHWHLTNQKVLEALDLFEGNKTHAARYLGVSVRWLRIQTNTNPAFERYKYQRSGYGRGRKKKISTPESKPSEKATDEGAGNETAGD